MSGLRDQLRKHYDEQSLPPEKVAAILASGRDAERAGAKVSEFPVRRFPLARLLAMAAAILLFGCLGVLVFRSDMERVESEKVSFAAVKPAILEFFSVEPQLPKQSTDKSELRQWLVANGAPAGFSVPKPLEEMKGFGCEVVNVQGRPGYLMCFWRRPPQGDDPGELIHLFAVRRSDFEAAREAAPEGGPPAVTQQGNWSFASWGEGEIVYTIATPAPVDVLQNLFSMKHLISPLVIARNCEEKVQLGG